MKYEVKIKNLPKSEVEIEVSLPMDFLVSARKRALDMFSLSLEIDGFRKGKVPKNVVAQKVGESQLLEEASDILLKEHFSKIILQEKLDIIGRPKISITKLAIGNPFEFKAVFSILPEIKLPDFKAIAKKEMSKPSFAEATASEEEIAEVLLQIRKNKAHFDWHNANPEHKEHDHPDIEKEENLPVLDDEFAKLAGNFKNLDELRSKVKENIILEKKNKNVEKKRVAIMDELTKNSEVEVPEILIESEIEKALAQMKDDVVRMGGKFEDYLEHIKKTEEETRKDLRESSEKKAKIQLIFNKIVEVEKLKVDETILENEVKQILEHYPDASDTNARIYVSTILLNSEVLKLLERQ